MRVSTRAVIWLNGKLVLTSQRIRGRSMLCLPGGRVRVEESPTEAVVRMAAHQTGLMVKPGPLLYVAELENELELIFLAEPYGTPGLGGVRAIDLSAGERPAVSPPVLDELARDASADYRQNPRWLGHLSGTALSNRR